MTGGKGLFVRILSFIQKLGLDGLLSVYIWISRTLEKNGGVPMMIVGVLLYRKCMRCAKFIVCLRKKFQLTVVSIGGRKF